MDEGGQAVVGARELRVLGEEFRSLPCQVGWGKMAYKDNSLVKLVFN